MVFLCVFSEVKIIRIRMPITGGFARPDMSGAQPFIYGGVGESLTVLNNVLAFLGRSLEVFVDSSAFCYLFWALALLSLTLLVFRYVFGGDFR